MQSDDGVLCALLLVAHSCIISQGASLSLDKLDLFPVSNTPINVNQTHRNKRRPVEEPLVADVSNNKELAKLQLYGSRLILM